MIRAILGGLRSLRPGPGHRSRGRAPDPRSAGSRRCRCDHIDLSARLRRGGGLPRPEDGRREPRPADAPRAALPARRDPRRRAVGRGHGVQPDRPGAHLGPAGAVRPRAPGPGRAVRGAGPGPPLDADAAGRRGRSSCDAYRRARGQRPGPPRVRRGGRLPAACRRRQAPHARGRGLVRPVVNVRLPVATTRRTSRESSTSPGRRSASAGSRSPSAQGGLHSDRPARVHYATKRHRLVSVDVGQLLPDPDRHEGDRPAAYGDCGADIYRGILDAGWRSRRGPRTRPTRPSRPGSRPRRPGLKLVLNSTSASSGPVLQPLRPGRIARP